MPVKLSNHLGLIPDREWESFCQMCIRDTELSDIFFHRCQHKQSLESVETDRGTWSFNAVADFIRRIEEMEAVRGMKLCVVSVLAALKTCKQLGTPMMYTLVDMPNVSKDGGNKDGVGNSC